MATYGAVPWCYNLKLTLIFEIHNTTKINLYTMTDASNTDNSIYFDFTNMDEDLISLGSMGSIPGYETSNNYHMIHDELWWNRDITEYDSYSVGYESEDEIIRHGSCNSPDSHRFDVPAQLNIPNPPSPMVSPMFMSDDGTTPDESDNEEYADATSPTEPPPTSPRLSRNIDVRKWLCGMETFYALKSHYDMYEKLKYVFVLLNFAINMYLPYPITWNEFVVIWIGIPFLGFGVIEYIQQRVIFNRTPKVSSTHLSYYPGYQHDYGCLIQVHHGNFHETTYEYWIVYNVEQKRAYQLIVRNYNYADPAEGPHF